jgi:DNA-binding beta-propeller fold protein YncE
MPGKFFQCRVDCSHEGFYPGSQNLCGAMSNYSLVRDRPEQLRLLRQSENRINFCSAFIKRTFLVRIWHYARSLDSIQEHRCRRIKKMKKLFSVFTMTVFAAGLAAVAQAAAPLKLVTKFTMPSAVKGHFDHLAADVPGNRLLLTAESAHEVLVFNLHTGRYLRAITGIGIPHAVFFRDDLNRIYITDGGAGELRIYNGKTYRQIGAIKLKVDSDSIGYDPATHDLYIVNGGGDAHEPFSMLSVVNTTTDRKVADIRIDGDTLEAMALDRSGPLLYINNPSKNLVDVVNRRTHAVVKTWPVTLGKRNVAMGFDPATHRLFVACRSGVIVVFDSESGKELQTLPIGSGVDDLIFDPASKRIYAACGNGVISVYDEDGPNHYTHLGDVAAARGSKNEVLVPQLERLFTTIPPQGTAPGKVYVYQVQ